MEAGRTDRKQNCKTAALPFVTQHQKLCFPHTLLITVVLMDQQGCERKTGVKDELSS